MKALVIPTEGDITVGDMPVNGAEGLEWLKEQVGGWIEGVGFDSRAHGYVNEEGKLEGLPPNFRATALLRAAGTIMPDDIIAGTLVLCGAVDRDGGDTALPDDVIEDVTLGLANWKPVG